MEFDVEALKPLVFKDYINYIEYIDKNHEKRDGFYEKLVIYCHEYSDEYEMTMIFLDRYQISNGIFLSGKSNWSISKKGDAFVYSFGITEFKSEIFFEKLKKSYPEYFTWLLFNPEWYILPCRV